MSDAIERIKQRIEARKWKITDDAFVPELIGMQYANNMNDWCLEIIDEELAKEPQVPQWIPCSERLPEESGDYLCYEEYEPNKFDIFIEEINCDGIFKQWNITNSERIIAWQPLPSVWKGENNG